MDQLPAYQGDAAFQELLTRISSPLSLPQVRTAIMRDIWAIDTIQPTETMEEVLGGKPVDIFKDADFAREFMLQFLALWSSLIPHLEASNPFRLYPLTGNAADELRLRHRTRVDEITMLMELFDFDKSSHMALAELIEPSEAILKQVLTTLDVEVPDEETATEVEAAQFAEALSSIEVAVETLFNQVGGRIVAARQDLINKRENHRQFLAAHKDIGRNDPCPCGSGKKFKKCCMGGPFLSLLETRGDAKGLGEGEGGNLNG